MHEVRGPEAPRPDDWGIEAYLPQTVGRDGPIGPVIRVGSALIALGFVALIVALLVT